jgi:hypothetical protein
LHQKGGEARAGAGHVTNMKQSSPKESQNSTKQIPTYSPAHAPAIGSLLASPTAPQEGYSADMRCNTLINNSRGLLDARGLPSSAHAGDSAGKMMANNLTPNLSGMDGRALASNLGILDGRTLQGTFQMLDKRGVGGNIPAAVMEGRSLSGNLPLWGSREMSGNVPMFEGRAMSGDIMSLLGGSDATVNHNLGNTSLFGLEEQVFTAHYTAYLCISIFVCVYVFICLYEPLV